MFVSLKFPQIWFFNKQCSSSLKGVAVSKPIKHSHREMLMYIAYGLQWHWFIETLGYYHNGWLYLVTTKHFSVIIRSSHQTCSIEKNVFKHFAKFTGKHLCQSLFKLSFSAQDRKFIRKEILHRCFPANFVKFLSTPFL